MQKPTATNLSWHEGEVSKEDRYELLRQRGATVWFTGLSASGKSTIAVALEKALLARGFLAYRLDGDNIRLGLNKNLGFSAEDRTENIRRVGELAKLFADTGVIALASFISPYTIDREAARSIHEVANLAFIEVYVECPLAEAEKRDPKGLYKKARSGQLPEFTGIDAPYEIPRTPELVLKTAQMTLAEEVDALLTYLLQRVAMDPV